MLGCPAVLAAPGEKFSPRTDHISVVKPLEGETMRGVLHHCCKAIGGETMKGVLHQCNEATGEETMKGALH